MTLSYLLRMRLSQKTLVVSCRVCACWDKRLSASCQNSSLAQVSRRSSDAIAAYNPFTKIMGCQLFQIGLVVNQLQHSLNRKNGEATEGPVVA